MRATWQTNVSEGGKGERGVAETEKSQEAKARDSNRSSDIVQKVEEVTSVERISLRQRLGKVGVLLAAITAGGSLVIFVGNWLLAATVVLMTVFRDEVGIAVRYASVIILVVICPGWSWEEKRQRINVHTQVFIQVLERDLVKKFLQREVV
jgi:hypothetical protein